MIVHIGIPDFYAAMEELRRPELRRCPLVLANPGERSVVQGRNRLAGKEGITEGMPLSRARRLCRRLRVIPSDYCYYREKHRDIIQDFGRFSPLVEGTYPGSYFIDVTGTRRLWGPEPDIACRMETELAAAMGLHGRIGLASNKLVSQVAANCIDPGDMSCIFAGNEASFLSPLPVHMLPGVGQVTSSRLADFNVQQIGQLASFPLNMLAGVFGKTADRLLKIAKGIDPAPVLPSRQPLRLSVTRDLERNEIDLERLEAALFRLSEDAGWGLRSHNRFPRSFRLEIRYADGLFMESRKQLSHGAARVDQSLFRFVLPMFMKLFRRRVAVSRMVLEFSELVMPFRQIALFPWDEKASAADVELQEALDGIRMKFGRRAITWGRTAQLDGLIRRPI